MVPGAVLSARLTEIYVLEEAIMTNKSWFIWEIGGSYASWSARSAQKRITAGSVFDGDFTKSKERTTFLRKILTREPAATDVIIRALDLVIGGEPGTYAHEEYAILVDSCTYLGEAVSLHYENEEEE